MGGVDFTGIYMLCSFNKLDVFCKCQTYIGMSCNYGDREYLKVTRPCYIQGRSLAQIRGGAVPPEQVPVPGVNSGVNVGDPGPSVCPYPIEMCM